MKKEESRTMGFLLIDKMEGIGSTSLDAVAKRIFSVRRAGHLGTLDPFASGLQIIAIGNMTKALSLVDDSFKTYEARLRLGYVSSTLDKDGEINEGKVRKDITIDEIRKSLSSFLGKTKQVPPLYSAKHIDGKRAYLLAREGKEFEIPPIEIEIKEISLLSFDKENKEISFSATVSKGTYIRTLGKDIAEKLSCDGYLVSLRRTKIGNITIDMASKIDDITSSSLLPFERIIDSDVISFDDTNRKTILNGGKIKIISKKDVLLIRDNERDIAIYVRDKDDIYRCHHVL